MSIIEESKQLSKGINWTAKLNKLLDSWKKRLSELDTSENTHNTGCKTEEKESTTVGG